MSAERARGLIAAGLVAAALACERRPEPTPRAEQADELEEDRPRPEPTPKPKPARPRARIDAHVHLVDGAVDELLAALDRHGIAGAVVLASPHLDPSLPRADEGDSFARWREANDRLLAETADHRDRLIPFVTVEPASVDLGVLAGWFEAGACGVKLYAGHRSLHARALEDPAHEPLFAELERRGAPVLLHLNSVRYEAELDALLARHPRLELVCAHLCGSRTDVDRLERILANHPSLRVDTSHGAGVHGIDGYTNLEREAERVRALIEAAPERFLFGSDLVTIRAGAGPEATVIEWDSQLAANLGLLEAEQFEYGRRSADPIEAERGIIVPGRYRGLALGDEVLERVLAANAEAWLASCRDR